MPAARLGAAVAELPPDLLRACCELAYRSPGPLLDGRRGLPIRTDRDGRLPDKLEACDTFMALQATAQEIGLPDDI